MKVLIVEDEVLLAFYYSEALQKAGFEIADTCASKDKAIESIKNNPFDIALLDIKLHSKDDGLVIAEFLKENYNIPYIFITGNSDEYIKKQAMTLEPLDYFVKPLKMENLINILKNLEN